MTITMAARSKKEDSWNTSSCSNPVTAHEHVSIFQVYHVLCTRIPKLVPIKVLLKLSVDNLTSDILSECSHRLLSHTTEYATPAVSEV